LEQGVVALGRLPGERQQQLPLRPEPLNERRRRKSDLAGDRQPGSAALARAGVMARSAPARILFVARQAGTRAHGPSWSHGRPRASHLRT
jgi:hypothetical protein